jgi:hypothetical protein
LGFGNLFPAAEHEQAGSASNVIFLLSRSRSNIEVNNGYPGEQLCHLNRGDGFSLDHLHLKCFLRWTAFDHLPLVECGCMKLKNLIPIQNEVVAHFGEAKIVKTPDGKYKLVGGSDQDHSDAQDWVAMFCPEIALEVEPAENSRSGLFGMLWCRGSI